MHPLKQFNTQHAYKFKRINFIYVDKISFTLTFLSWEVPVMSTAKRKTNKNSQLWLP